MKFAKHHISSAEGHPVSLSHEDLRVADSVGNCDEPNISRLLEMLVLVGVKESRGLRGRVYGLVFMVVASLVAVLAGASNFRQIADHIDDFRRR